MAYNQVFLDIFYPLTTPKFLVALKSPNDCRLPQPDIDFIRGWCAATCMNISMSENRFITLRRKIKPLIYDYNVFDSYEKCI
jgi:hypothetical protein